MGLAEKLGLEERKPAKAEYCCFCGVLCFPESREGFTQFEPMEDMPSTLHVCDDCIEHYGGTEEIEGRLDNEDNYDHFRKMVRYTNLNGMTQEQAKFKAKVQSNK